MNISLIGNKTVIWENFKNRKINELLLSFNHSKTNETKILLEKKYESKLDPKLIDTNNVLNSKLKEFQEANDSNSIHLYFNYEGLAWASKFTSFKMDDIIFSYPNVLKNSVNDLISENLLQIIINENNNKKINKFFDKLTLEQMNQLAKINNDIVNNSNYISHYLKKILPIPISKLRIDSNEFKCLEEFTNSLKDTKSYYDMQYFILHLKLKNAIIERKPFNEDDFIT